MLSEGSLRRALERVGLQAPRGMTRLPAPRRPRPSSSRWRARPSGRSWRRVTRPAAAAGSAGPGRTSRGGADVLRGPASRARPAGRVCSRCSPARRWWRRVATSATAAACKWPNDVLVDGRKAAGILAESSVADGRFEHVVLGIGANLGSRRPTFRRRVQCGRTRPSCSVGSCRRSSARTDRGMPTSRTR